MKFGRLRAVAIGGALSLLTRRGDDRAIATGSLVGLFVFISVALFANNGRAATVLDQSATGDFTAEFVAGSCCNLAQTFTVGIGGQLTSIKLDLNNYQGGAQGILTVEILNTVSGLPGTSVLGTATIDASAVTYHPLGFPFDPNNLQAYTFNFNPIGVAVGDVLTIGLFGPGNFFAADGSTGQLGSIYSGGELYSGGPGNWHPAVGFQPADGRHANLFFETIVDVASTPLPAALPLFATGLGALGLLGWRRKRKTAAAG